YARPRVTIVSTGDELVPADARARSEDATGSAPGAPAAALPVGQVRDSSAPALAALVRDAGGEPSFAGIVPDDREALTAKLSEALTPKGNVPLGCHVLVLSARPSV